MNKAGSQPASMGITMRNAIYGGLSKAAVHRVLASLRSRGLVDLDERTRRYSLGVSTMKLGLAYLDR
ncbi:MAG: IclR family transcriptional regulator, partial [Acidobacteriota bacterium]